MPDLKLRKRHRLRRKEIAQLATFLESAFGCKTFSEDQPLEVAEFCGSQVIVFEGRAIGLYLPDGRPTLSVRGMLSHAPTRSWVTVDMGAVKFIANGADVMAPGVTDADQGIAAGDIVWIRDEKNSRPLSVGLALVSGQEMKAGKGGKAVKTVHYVGDKIWALGDES